MKQHTKLFFVTLLLSCAAFFSIVYISCNKPGNSDKCAAISCAYGGRCDDGKCICPVGYEGTNCEIISRNKFLGSWNVTEKGTITIEKTYNMAIEADVATGANSVLIKNLYNYFSNSLRATITKDTIYIPNQQLMGKIVFGKGFIYTDTLGMANGKISMRYEVVDSANNLIVDDFGYYSELDASNPSGWTKQP